MTTMRHTLTFLFASLAASLLPATPAHAGGPFLVRANGTPYTWNTASAISYRTDNGPLSATVNESTARSRVLSMFTVWQNVASSSISYSRAGFINSTAGFSDGDVSTGAEYDAVEAACNSGSQSPVIYDADGAIFTDLGIDVESILGFAGPCAIDASNYVSGQAVMNGLFQDGQAAPVADISTAEFNAAFVHEFGHFSGLDHSQINANCKSIITCSADQLTGLPTMFPFLVDQSQGVLSMDDEAWISKLYPQTTGASSFLNTHGMITGVVFFSDGESHAQLVNVVARRVDNPGTAVDERSAFSVSVISGYKFRLFHGNSINDPAGSNFGTEAPGDIGLFEIPVPPGSYTIEFESIDPEFVEGSSIGGPVRIDQPGSASPLGPVNVTAGATVSGNDVILGGTDPRFDQFEGP